MINEGEEVPFSFIFASLISIPIDYMPIGLNIAIIVISTIALILIRDNKKEKQNE